MSDMKITVMLPTRGRTDALKRSITSMLDTCDHAASIEFLLAFDADDESSSTWFQEHVAPLVDHAGSSYTCYQFARLGYLRLNEYINYLAGASQGRWLMFWGDDAIMQTAGWDSMIDTVSDFRVVRIPTHKQHPYAIFPIVPRDWYQLFGYVSAHQLTDSWVSQIGYILDIVQNVPIEVVHDRFDITGNNNDATYQNRPMLEGNPKDPRDFNHVDWRAHRWRDCQRLRDVLSARGQDMSWFDSVLRGEQDPWEKMCSPEYDPNKQIAKLKL